jgi:hypothetical protein
MGGQLIFAIYFRWIFGIGISLDVEYKTIHIWFPFISIYLCLDKEAEGYEIFGHTKIKSPRKTFLGFTWVGWLNIIILQWFFIRLSYCVYPLKNWRIIFGIYPLTGWWSDFNKL